MLSFIEIRNLFEANGISVAGWSRDHGFPSALVYRVLRGEAKCRLGETHKIAVALGIKPKTSQEQGRFLEILNYSNETADGKFN